jgi:lipid A 3-O-deacylase
MTFANAADLPMVLDGAPARTEGTTWDIRFGAALHGVGSHEHNTTDLMGEILTPRLPFFQDSILQYLMPRLHGGGSVNLDGRTSFGYAGFAWTWPIYRGFFFEPFIGAAAHNGSIAGSPTMSALGCDYLFHAGGSVGYRFDAHWSLIGTFEHLSNGKQLFGVNCGSNQIVPGSNGNQGLNNYGVKIGYSF